MLTKERRLSIFHSVLWFLKMTTFTKRTSPTCFPAASRGRQAHPWDNWQKMTIWQIMSERQKNVLLNGSCKPIFCDSLFSSLSLSLSLWRLYIKDFRRCRKTTFHPYLTHEKWHPRPEKSQEISGRDSLGSSSWTVVFRRLKNSNFLKGHRDSLKIGWHEQDPEQRMKL